MVYINLVLLPFISCKRLMKNKLLATALATATAFSNSAFATNGDTLIGLGAISRSMGGTGIAHFAGAESALKNPALLAKQKGHEVMFGGTFFAPDVEATTTGTAGAVNDLTATSDAKDNMIPEVAIAHALDDGWVIGVGMFGSAGMGTDWRDSAPMVNSGAGQVGLYSMRSNLLLLKFAVPFAYGKDNWSVGIAPVLQYGALDLAFANTTTTQIGQGSSYDFGMGFDLGFSFDIPDSGITLGLVYESAIGMTYDHQISNAATAFSQSFTDELEQPAQIGVGINWANDQMAVTFDIKSIKWGDAGGYKDFGWENQTVYALGVEYLIDKLSVRFGYNHGKNPIVADTTSSFAGDVVNTFNHVMFPAITEDHYTAGFGYAFSEKVELDMAFTFATSPSATVSAGNTGLGNLTVTNDQTAITAGIKYNF
jgi:long-chain fatty acid transport protein